MVIQDAPPPPPAAESHAAPEWDLTVGLINATVQLDQPSEPGRRTVGTGFLVSAPTADGAPRTVLVTAAHVLTRMTQPQARVGWRAAQADGSWKFAPEPLDIRSPDGSAKWTQHPTQDIAVMTVRAPEAFARAAIPLDWLADASTFEEWRVGPGDELMALGYPYGLSSNRAGFPILRLGHVSSYPLTPISAFPTFLLDFAVSSGNSGGPVFWAPSARRRPDAPTPDHPFIAGVLTQEVQGGGEGIDLGVVAHAQYVRETLAMMDAASEAATPASRRQGRSN